MIRLYCVITMAILFLATSAFAFTYDHADLKKFEETNSCMNCNLADIPIYSRDHQHANLEGTNFSKSVLYGDYTRANFMRTVAINSDFEGTFSEVKFNNAILINARFVSINLTGSDFTNANVSGANFSGALLYGAKITEDQLATAKSVCNAILPGGSKGKC